MIVKGPFTLKWGDNTILDVEDISIDHEISSDEFETLQGKSYEIDGSYKASAVITLLAGDIPALAALLPQNFVENGGVLSTGETVDNADGAMDFTPAACTISTTYNNLDIISCANPALVLRIVNARTKVDAVELDGKVQKVMVKFVGEPGTDEATLQMFIEGTIAVVS